jgi:small GTP-binding protein
MPYTFKILVGGDAAVGKTTLIHRLKTGNFTEKFGMTIGVDFQTHKVNYEGNDVVFQVWDLGGQERFRHILEMYTMGAKAAILMHDLTRPETAEKLETWLDLVRLKDKNLPVMVLGSKLDLVDQTAVEKRKDANIFKKMAPLDHFYVSAKSGVNVEKILWPICKKLFEPKA